ncbi:MAG: hypothetical protein WC758_07175 [Candidatus Woesearchaeota archaeon]|jgi:hypothetical protein
MIKKVALIFITLFFCLFLAFFYHKQIFALRFFDEEETFAAGKYLNQEEHLYSDLITSHQPLTTIASSVLQKVSHPDNLLMLIKRHREAIIIYSVIWDIILVASAGFTGFLFVLIFETTKILLFGNLFIAESLITYPLIFLVIFATKKIRVTYKHAFIYGILITSCLFLLAPIWPLIIYLAYLLVKKFDLRQRWVFLLGSIAVLLVVIPFFDPLKYWEHTIINNFKYTIPATSYFGPWYMTFAKGFFAPLISLTHLNGSLLLWLERGLVVGLLTYFVISFLQHKYRPIIFTFVLLGLANLRFYTPGLDYYQGFHSLPWFSLLIYLSLSSLIKSFQKIDIKLVRILIVGELGVIILLSSLIFIKYLLPTQDKQRDFYVNYSQEESYGQVIKLLSNSPNDNLFVYPDNWLIYWSSGLNHGFRNFGYFQVLSQIPKFSKSVNDMFIKSPPTFFYCEKCSQSSFVNYLPQYDVIKRDGKNTDLYLLKTKVLTLTQEQLKQLKYFQYDL